MMPQIVPARQKQSRFSQVGQALSAGAGSLLEYHQQRQQLHQQEQQKRMEDAQFEQLTGMDISGIHDPKIRQQAFASVMQGQNEDQKFKNQLELQKNKFGFEKELAGLKEEKGPSFKDQMALEDQKLVKERGQKAFNEMAELTSSLGRGSGLMGFFGGKTAKNTGKFLALTGALEAMLVDLVNRGTLSNKRFEYITETLLPKPTDTQDMIKGKMEGLADILGLDKSSLNPEGKGINKGKQSLEDIFG